MQNDDLISGWVEELKSSIFVDEASRIFSKCFEMKTARKTRSIRKRSFAQIRLDVLQGFTNHLEKHFQNDADIRTVHKIFATDLNLATLSFEYNGMVQNK